MQLGLSSSALNIIFERKAVPLPSLAAAAPASSLPPSWKEPDSVGPTTLQAEFPYVRTPQCKWQHQPPNPMLCLREATADDDNCRPAELLHTLGRQARIWPWVSGNLELFAALQTRGSLPVKGSSFYTCTNKRQTKAITFCMLL